MHNKARCFYCIPVLQGLMEVRSPYLEELLSLLMTVGTQNGTAGPVATVISLLLQESEERAVKKEVDSNKWAPQFYFPLKSCKKHLYLTGLNDKRGCLRQKQQSGGCCLRPCTQKPLLDLVWKGLIGFAASLWLYRFTCCENHRTLNRIFPTLGSCNTASEAGIYWKVAFAHGPNVQVDGVIARLCVE